MGRLGEEDVVPWVEVWFSSSDSSSLQRKMELEQQLGAWLLLRLDVDSLTLRVMHQEESPPDGV